MKEQNIYKIDAHMLRVFLKVCERQSVSRAAEHFDLNQSTVSNMMDRFHLLVGYKLFERVGRNIVPNENAKDLIPRASSIVSAIEGLSDTGTYNPLEDQRPVTISANLNSLIGVLQCIRDAIWVKSPGKHVRFLELGSRDQLEDKINDSTVDFAIALRTPRYPPAAASQLLFQDRSVVFYDGTQRAAPADREEYLAARHGVLDFGGRIRSAVELNIHGYQSRRDVVCSASNAGVLAQMIKGTDIIASMPSHLRHHAFRTFSWAPLPLNPNVTLNFDLIWHKRNANSSRHRWLLKTILDADIQKASRAMLD